MEARERLRLQWDKMHGRAWIPVSERLPEPFNKYGISPSVIVAFADGRIAMANCMNNTGKIEWNSTGDNDGEPTHWMPLPHPPAT
jgi:hypothetical protein